MAQLTLYKTVNNDGEYSCGDIGITTDEWFDLLSDNGANQYINTLLLFLREPNHTGSCNVLALKYGKPAQHFSAKITAFSKWVEKKLNRFHVVGTDGSDTYWCIAMQKGWYTPDGFQWQLRDELVNALHRLHNISSLDSFVRNYWLVGYSFGSNNSQFDRFIKESVWECWFSDDSKGDQSQLSLTQTIQTGDVLILKSACTKGTNHDIPFLRVKAVAIVENDIELNKSDGKTFCSCKVKYSGIQDNDFDDAALSSVRKTIHYCNTDAKTQPVIDYANSILNLIDTNSMKYQKFIDLLIANKNLILTGAPGTGKTYLANEIAKCIISQKSESSPLDVLKNAIKKYEHIDFGEAELLNSFSERFPKETIKEMSLEDYCIGRGDVNKDNFCYWIERKLKPLGSYSPGSSKSYLLYWNKMDEEYRVAGYLKKESSTDVVTLMQVLACDIHKLVNDNNPDAYSNKFGDSFILKILNSYYPNQYFPINSQVHINNIVKLFDIQCNDNVFEKNRAIYKFYLEQCRNTDISPFDFMRILYDNFNIKDGEIKQDNGFIEIKGSYDLVQFHPSYDYTDFVEGLRPIKGNNENVCFERKDGAFKRFCVTALNNPNKNFVFIIDEINRGEVSKIFGELFFSIDPGYRGEKGKVQTQYANMETEPNDFDDALGETERFGHFFVPENVYIIGTMNDIDRSVESMDFAMRRRFAWKEVTAEDSMQMLDGLDNADEMKARMVKINDEILRTPGLGKAYQIGAAYFKKYELYNDFDLLWEYHLEGLLFEYLRGTTDIDKTMKKLADAYGYTKSNKYEPTSNN